MPEITLKFWQRATRRVARLPRKYAIPMRARRVLRHGYNEPMSGSDRVKPAGSGLKLTYDDFVLFPDDGRRHELIDGEHYVTPSPNTRHQQISMNLTMMIGGWLETHPRGRLFYAPFDVVFSKYDVVEPDLLYVSNERSNVLTAPNVQGAPDLVIEIGSPGTRRRDETIKRNLYGRSDVSEYWIVDPAIDVIRVYRQSGGGFGRPIELSREAGDVLTTALLPGLDMPLARILRE
jgi:Uma2 family endonuclease